VTPEELAATTSAGGEEISISECAASFHFERTIVGVEVSMSAVLMFGVGIFALLSIDLITAPRPQG